MRVEKADAFRRDFASQALWYVRRAEGDLAHRFQQAVDSTLRLLCDQPGIGRERRFRNPRLQGLRSLVVERPFQRLVIFYRVEGETLQAIRLMHGARDLPRRLADPPGPVI